MNPEQILTREALTRRAVTHISAGDHEDYSLQVLSNALKEMLKQELLSEGEKRRSTYSVLER